MIESRRCPNAQHSSDQTPQSSGPRWAWASIIDFNPDLSDPPVVETIPAIPHILDPENYFLSSPVVSALAALHTLRGPENVIGIQ
jgi:hypothetical protein